MRYWIDEDSEEKRPRRANPAPPGSARLTKPADVDVPESLVPDLPIINVEQRQRPEYNRDRARRLRLMTGLAALGTAVAPNAGRFQAIGSGLTRGFGTAARNQREKFDAEQAAFSEWLADAQGYNREQRTKQEEARAEAAREERERQQERTMAEREAGIERELEQLREELRNERPDVEALTRKRNTSAAATRAKVEADRTEGMRDLVEAAQEDPANWLLLRDRYNLGTDALREIMDAAGNPWREWGDVRPEDRVELRRGKEGGFHVYHLRGEGDEEEIVNHMSAGKGKEGRERAREMASGIATGARYERVRREILGDAADLPDEDRSDDDPTDEGSTDEAPAGDTDGEEVAEPDDALPEEKEAVEDDAPTEDRDPKVRIRGELRRLEDDPAPVAADVEPASVEVGPEGMIPGLPGGGGGTLDPKPPIAPDERAIAAISEQVEQLPPNDAERYVRSLLQAGVLAYEQALDLVPALAD